MKKYGFAIEVGRIPENVGRKKKDMDKVKVAETLARVVDEHLCTALFVTEMSFDSYVDALNHIWAYTDREQYKLAIEMMHVLCLAMDKDSTTILEEIIMPDAVLTEAFLDYFGEYITDGYIIERILERSEKEDDSVCDKDEEEQKLFDVHFDEVKEFFKKEDDVDE